MAPQKHHSSKRRSPKRRARAPQTNQQVFQHLWSWFLPDHGVFATLTFHGNCRWLPNVLVGLALCWSWSECRNLTDAFTEAAGCCQKIFGSVAVSTYQGFLGALVTWTPRFLPLLRGVVQERMAQLGSHWECEGWVLLGFDGSRATAPRTVSNETAFCAPNYGQSRQARSRRRKKKQQPVPPKDRPCEPQEPQTWLTLLWHMELRLPWSWRLGPSHSSEREHVLDMVHTEQFPKNALFCGDAGFVGYPLWSGLQQRGYHFLVRVGANVSLLSEHLDWAGTKGQEDLEVLCWPLAAQRLGQVPLRLRLLRVRVGKTKVWLLTSVLDKSRLTAASAVLFYKKRWGIEVEFRGLKQTLGRAELRCRNAQRLLVELDWSLLALAVAELFALKEQLSASPVNGVPADPAKRSLAKTVRALRVSLRNLSERPWEGQELWSLLRNAVTDSYVRQRSKQARYRPRNPDKKPLGDPKLRTLNQQERKKLQKMTA